MTSQVSSSAGIYRISVKMKDDSLKVIYVGQSADLKQRMLQYVNEDTDNECLLKNLQNYMIFFRVAEVATQEGRDAGEKALFEHFSPECNDPDSIPAVQPSNINLFDN